MNKNLPSLLFLTLSSVCFSQTDSLNKIKVSNLNEITISGIRSDKIDPVPETTFSKEDIDKNHNGQDFGSFISKTNSITWYSDGGGSQNGYQYFRMRGLDQTKVNFTLNGVPMSESEDFGFYQSNFTDFLSNISSVQIQRGSGVTSSGNSSFVGSVNFDGPNLRNDSLLNDVQVGAGSYNTKRISTGFNTGLMKSGFAVYGRFSNTQSDGYRYNSGTYGNTLFTSLGYFSKKNTLKLTFFSGHSTNQMAYLASSEFDINNDRRNNPLTPKETDDFRQDFIQLQHTIRLGDNSFLTSSVSHIGLTGNYGYLDQIYSTLYIYKLMSESYEAMSTYSFLTKKFNFRVGINGNYFYRNHSMQIAPDLNQDVYDNIGNKNEFSAFTKISYNIIKKLSLFADLQYRQSTFSYTQLYGYDVNSQVKPVTWSFLNPKGGIRYVFNQMSDLYFSISQTHKESTRSDMLAGADNIDQNNVKEVGDLSLVKPEQVTDYELGYNHFVSFKNNLSANLFCMNFHNEIAPIGQLSKGTGLPIRKNVDKSTREGVEFQYVREIAPGIMANGNITYMESNISTYKISSYNGADSVTYKNVEPLLSPHIIINQGIDLSIIKNKASLILSATYISKSYLDNTNNDDLTLPSSIVFNAGVSYKLADKFRINFMCNNFMNSNYYNSGYTSGFIRYYYVGAPRNFYLNIVFNFSSYLKK